MDIQCFIIFSLEYHKINVNNICNITYMNRIKGLLRIELKAVLSRWTSVPV